ncbi:hypothetical protein LTR62_004882 [Meristemomyces frigidus]|uniref:Splicing factor YJU2 n=1 Tax=Meristemomyces frigidus TaxID=1508187 RepID=A0AAN7TDZ8_9PEZI|nr:hypothetical protein LTR62_004882 [Meristemomyces frigidus]
MSERKVLQKYFPPDFDPSVLERRNKGPKTGSRQLQTIRLMAPFSMKCTSCGEYIYKGRKFNARKETTEEKYYAISIYRFYIRCTRCSAEITFKTDPKNMDYTCERGARRNFEVWREAKLNEETEEERLDRLEREESERDVMKELEKKTDDARTEMAVADALDDVRTRNAMRERTDVEGALSSVTAPSSAKDEEAERLEREDEEAARKAFTSATGEKVRRLDEEIELDDAAVVEESGSGSENVKRVDSSRNSIDTALMPPPSAFFKPKVREKRGPGLLAGIKRKEVIALVGYGDDDDED